MSLIVFDLDGVLIDSRQANVQAFCQGLRAAGVSIPEPDTICQLIGLSAQEMLLRLGCPPQQVETIYREVVHPFYLQNLPRLAQAVDSASEVLEQLLRRGHRLAACTSGERQLQQQALSSLELTNFFEAMQTPNDSVYRKPQVEYLQELLDRLDYHGPVVLVEDSPVGLKMGLEAGAITVFADYGFGQPGALIPHHRIQQLGQLLEVASCA